MRTLMSKRELLRRVPYSYPTIWDKMRRGEFPKSVKLDDGGHKVAWYEDEVQEWIENRQRVELKPADGDEAAEKRREPAEAAPA